MENGFVTFMCSPDGGRRDRGSAVNMMGDIRRMVNCLDIKDKLHLILDAQFVRVNYLDDPPRLKGKKDAPLRAASVRKYLNSYVNFLTFIIIDQIQLTEDIDFLEVINLKIRAVNWYKSYSGEEKEQVCPFWQK